MIKISNVLSEGFNRMAKSPVDISTNGATTLKLCREAIQTFYLPKLIEANGSPSEIQWLQECIQEVTDAIDASTHPNGAVIDEAKNGFDLTGFGSLQNLVKKQVGFYVKGRPVKMDFFISQEVLINEECPYPETINGRRNVCQYWWDVNHKDSQLPLESTFLSIMDKLGIKVGVFYKEPRFLGYKQRAYHGSFSTAKIMTALKYNEIQDAGTSSTGVEISARSLMEDIKTNKVDVLNDLRKETRFVFDKIFDYKVEKDRLVKLKNKMEKKADEVREFKEQELAFLSERRFSKKESVKRFLPHCYGTQADEESHNEDAYLGIVSKLEKNRTEMIDMLSNAEFKSSKIDLVNGLLMACQKDHRVGIPQIEECMPFFMLEFAKKSQSIWNGTEWIPEVKQTFQPAFEDVPASEEEPMFFDAEDIEEVDMMSFEAPTFDEASMFSYEDSEQEQWYQ